MVSSEDSVVDTVTSRVDSLSHHDEFTYATFSPTFGNFSTLHFPIEFWWDWWNKLGVVYMRLYFDNG